MYRLPSFGNLLFYLRSMEYEQSFATLENLLLRNVIVNRDADTIRMLLLKPGVTMKNPHYYLDLALGAAAKLYKDCDYETVIEILIGVFELDGIEDGENAESPLDYCKTVVLMEILLTLCFLKKGAVGLAFDYIEVAFQNIDTYLAEDKLYNALAENLLELGHSLIAA